VVQFDGIAAEGAGATDGLFMKAPAVDYVRPRSLAEAVDLLAKHPGEARVIAGGQSLVAMMNLRVASPGLLIDISRLPELSTVSDGADAVTVGACVTHAAIEDGRVADPSRGLMPRVAASLAYRAIRTRGTIGGSLALSDPAAEWPAVLTALEAEVTVCGSVGRRCQMRRVYHRGLRDGACRRRDYRKRADSSAVGGCPLGLSEAVPQIGRICQRPRSRDCRSYARSLPRRTRRG
jgi:CO/xanthine dehydrogenase FAD-binding subunit